jgi:hypothetical protein
MGCKSVEVRHLREGDVSSIVWTPGSTTAILVDGSVRVVCEACGSLNIDFCGHDIDKCCDCGHWRYR